MRELALSKWAVALLLLLAPFVAKADSWTQEERDWFLLAQITQVVDYQVTRDLLYNRPPGAFKEMNPLIGPYPSRDRLLAFQVGTMVGKYFLADYLDHEARLRFLQFHVALELLVIGHNVQLGGRIQF